MSQLSLSAIRKPSVPIHRKVRKEYRAGDQIGFVTLSFSKKDGTKYHPALDVKTAEWSCTCPTSGFRPHVPCKHVLRAAESAVRNREAEPSLLARLGLKCCFRCSTTEDLFPMCHDDLTIAHDVFVCENCAAALRAEAGV